MRRVQYSPLLTAKEVAAILGTTPPTVYGYVSRGLLPAVRPPDPSLKWMRFRPCDVEAFLGVALETRR